MTATTCISYDNSGYRRPSRPETDIAVGLVLGIVFIAADLRPTLAVGGVLRRPKACRSLKAAVTSAAVCSVGRPRGVPDVHGSEAEAVVIHAGDC